MHEYLKHLSVIHINETSMKASKQPDRKTQNKNDILPVAVFNH